MSALKRAGSKAVCAFPSPPQLAASPERKAAVDRAAARIAAAPTDQVLRKVAFVGGLGDWTETNVLAFWLLNVELTKRGIAPRWRGLPRPGDAPEEAVSMAPKYLTESPMLNQAGKLSLMLRWADVQWLATVYPDHYPERPTGLRMFQGDTSAAWHIVTRLQPPCRIVQDLTLTTAMQLGLQVFVNSDTRHRHQVAARFMDRIRPKLDRLEALGVITAEQKVRRLTHCHAIRLAQGSPQLAADLVQQMTGQSITRSSMAQMRDKLTRQLGVRFHRRKTGRHP